jgi:ATP-dependent DNA helicase DinG
LAADSPSSHISVEDAFALVSECNAGYQLRTQQLEMAHAVHAAFRRKETGIFEAGTGTGKSLAALVPAVLSGKRVVVSTATIALQEQYVYKDLPLLRAAMPFDFKFALMKGRSNYLSLRRYRDFLFEEEIDPRLKDWVQATETGDSSELSFMPPSQTWFEIDSDKDDCLQAKCPSFSDCFYFRAKDEATNADVIVVNHALLLADAASAGNILPEYELLIVDEAQHIPEIAREVFSLSISNRGLKFLLNKASKQLALPVQLSRAVEIAADDVFMQLADEIAAGKGRIREPRVEVKSLESTLLNIKLWMQSQEFESVLDVELAREKVRLKAKALISTVSVYLACLDVLQNPSEDWVVWAENSVKNGRIEVIAAPLVVAPFVQEMLFGRKGLESSVWMSATLATGGVDAFDYFKKQIGVEERVLQASYPSPFNYRKQAVMYLPRHLPDPNDPSYIGEAAQEIEKIVRLSFGRAFVLFTSYQAMNAAFEILHDQLPFECRRQGEMPRKQLIDWFMHTSSAVLFGTSSFWEGISIDGEQLSCVVIDRIPFQVPDDPIYEAQCEALQRQPGRSWFNELALPHAIMRLKQGVGRLIRTENDAGVVAILDPRLSRKAYGSRIIECLPPMRIVSQVPQDVSLEQLLRH